MRQGLLLTGLGIAVWGAATLFFRLFGHWVLAEPGDPFFGSSLFLLELLTLLVLIGLALIVRLKWFPERGSAVKFGFIAAAAGLLLDSVTVWQRDAVFPAFSAGQHHTFTVWMTMGYALVLLVPAAVDGIIRDKAADTAEKEKKPEGGPVQPEKEPLKRKQAEPSGQDQAVRGPAAAGAESASQGQVVQEQTESSAKEQAGPPKQNSAGQKSSDNGTGTRGTGENEGGQLPG